MDDSFVVKSHDVSIDRDYINWLHEIKDRYRTSQIKAVSTTAVDGNRWLPS